MQFSIGLSRLQTLAARNHFLAALSAGLVVANLLLVGLTTWALLHRERIVVPVVTRQSFSVTDTAVDASYLRQMSLFFAATRLTVTPETVAENHQILLDYARPEFYHALLAQLALEEKAIQAQKISSVFYPTEVIPDPKNLSVIVKGRLQRWVGDLALPRENKAYRIQYRYRLGALSVADFTEMGGADHDQRH